MRAFHEIDIAGTYNASRPSNVVVRNDFRSTVFWQPDVVTNKDGKATVKVKYPDSTTSWKATARAATSTNQFGIGEGTMRTINREFLKDGTNEIRIARKSGKGALYFAANAQFFSREESIKAAGNEIFVKREYYKLVGRPTLLKGYVYDKVKLTEGESALRTRHVYQELRDRKVALFLDKLPEGVWQIRYEMRAETPGNFHALPVLGHAMYVPEIRCNGEAMKVVVTDQ